MRRPDTKARKNEWPARETREGRIPADTRYRVARRLANRVCRKNERHSRF
jgi:hypothetical protein